MKRFFTIISCLGACLAGCSNEDRDNCAFVPETKNIRIDLQMESLEDSLPSVTTKGELVTFLTRHPILRDQFLGRSGYPNDSIFINELFRRFTNLSMDTLLMATHSVFGNGSELRDQFRSGFANFIYYYPSFKPPKIQTMISGIDANADLLVSDTLVVIGLDYYLGSGARYRPNMYEYMLRRYNKNFIAPSVFLLYGIDAGFNKTELSDKTVLADMVAYGKAYYFAKRMMPCVPDSVLIGFTADEIRSARENENLIYARLVENEVMFSTSHQIKQRYLAERPKTLEIGERCPGRIGQWIGWQIVEAYARRNPGKSLQEIMDVPKASTLFNESRYRPEKK